MSFILYRPIHGNHPQYTLTRLPAQPNEPNLTAAVRYLCWINYLRISPRVSRKSMTLLLNSWGFSIMTMWPAPSMISNLAPSIFPANCGEYFGGLAHRDRRNDGKKALAYTTRAFVDPPPTDARVSECVKVLIS